MSKYHREAWETYHIFLLEADRKEELEREISEYLDQYLASDTVYGMKKKKLAVSDMETIFKQINSQSKEVYS